MLEFMIFLSAWISRELLDQGISHLAKSILILYEFICLQALCQSSHFMSSYPYELCFYIIALSSIQCPFYSFCNCLKTYRRQWQQNPKYSYPDKAFLTYVSNIFPANIFLGGQGGPWNQCIHLSSTVAIFKSIINLRISKSHDCYEFLLMELTDDRETSLFMELFHSMYIISSC